MVDYSDINPTFIGAKLLEYLRIKVYKNIQKTLDISSR